MVRPFVPKDAVPVLVLARNSPGAAQWSEQSYLDLDASGFLGWVADDDGKIVGFLVIRLINREAELLNLAVHISHRRMGIGTNLLSTVVEHLRTAGVTHVFLEVRESNHAAITFYQKCGFVRSGRRPDYYRYPNETAVLMDRILTG